MIPLARTPAAEQPCVRCLHRSPEHGKTFQIVVADCYEEAGQVFHVDVDEAYAIAKADGRLPLWSGEDDQNFVRMLATHCEETLAHVSHVPLVRGSYGLMIQLRFTRRDTGQTEPVHILVDGNHRAARSLAVFGLAYFYALTEEESARVVYGDILQAASGGTGVVVKFGDDFVSPQTFKRLTGRDVPEEIMRRAPVVAVVESGGKGGANT